MIDLRRRAADMRMVSEEHFFTDTGSNGFHRRVHLYAAFNVVKQLPVLREFQKLSSPPARNRRVSAIGSGES